MGILATANKISFNPFSGAAVGPLVTGFLSHGKQGDWDNVFYFLMVSELVSCLVSLFPPYNFHYIIEQRPITSREYVPFKH
jgi:hypothetical protein